MLDFRPPSCKLLFQFVFTFVWTVNANMNIYNMFKFISLWCATQSPTQKCWACLWTSRYVSVTDACKKTCIQLCGVLEKLWPDRFEASTIVYARLLPSNYADGLWYTMLIWISLITLTLACIYCIIFRLNFLLW